jgi:aminoglycoside phosphotransferase family enzyme
MDVMDLVARFRRGHVRGPEGLIGAERALLTRKSLLVFTRQSVLKLRRPRLVEGYDQSMMSVRYGMTARERWVGRRFAPGAYLEDCVLQVAWEPTGFDEEGADEVFIQLVPGLVEGEPVVAMCRLPDACRADVMLSEGRLDESDLTPFLERLVAFQAEAYCHREPPFGAGERPAERWRQTLRELDAAEGLFPSEAARARWVDETEGWLEAHAGTFAHRVMEGRVRETHGGVALEHIFLGTEHGPVLVDPEDGPDEARTIDIGEEIFRLAVELELAGARALGEEVLEQWAGLARDATLRKVGPFFRKLALARLAAEQVRAHRDEAPDPEAFERARMCVAHALEG